MAGVRGERYPFTGSRAWLTQAGRGLDRTPEYYSIVGRGVVGAGEGSMASFLPQQADAHVDV